ncbi:MAG: STAS domain-containing protein [Phycisphaeraceae bacterium]|nr:STAS domain-containing protein [Phycisphaeraceae bacterium]
MAGVPTDRLEPQLLTLLRGGGYSLDRLRRDLLAGIVVGIVALPLAIAFGIASGVRPEQGLITAIVAGFLISGLSGSRFQIGGPTGAFIVIIFGVVQTHGYSGLATATMLAGFMLILMGAFRLGGIIKFVPYPVIVGFTSGIAVIILASQVPASLGLVIEEASAHLPGQVASWWRNIGETSPAAALMTAGGVVFLVLWPRVTTKLPGPILVVVGATVAAKLLGLDVETIRGRFGEIPSTLPAPRLPDLSLETIRQVFSPAVSIALLAGIESLLSCVVADGMTGGRHRSNTELVAQGVANVAAPIFGGIPATGAIARTGTNVRSGATSPVAGIVHALFVLLVVLFAGRWASEIPLCALASILLVVAWRMADWHLFARMFRGPRSDALVMLVTFGLTLFVDLVVAIQVGVVLASLLFMHRMSVTTQAGFITRELREGNGSDDPDRTSAHQIPHGVEVFEIDGPFFFGAAERFQNMLFEIEHPPKVLILRMRHVPVVDATGLRALSEIHERCRHQGTHLVLSGVQPQPARAIGAAGLTLRLGPANVCASFAMALGRARAILEG